MLAVKSVITTATIPQININKLVKNFYIKEGRASSESFQNSDTDPVLLLDIDCSTPDRKIVMNYKAIDESTTMEYEIRIEALKSNLGSGKGFNLYWRCPVSGKRAKILYYCHSTHYFLHRTALSKRLRYPYEHFGKMDKLFAFSEYNQNKILNNFLRMKKETYRGEQTKINKKIGSLIQRKILLDRLINEWTEKHGSKNY